jgi:2-polyprenyl-6-methoxyphenol hydroxylase-like FAD-dependent oxidoreductase
MRVAVIGAGIGGLAVVAGLQRAGAEVVVYERAAEIRAVGAGLSLFGNGFTALDALGLGEQVRALGGSGLTTRAGQRDPGGRWLSRTPPDSVAQLAVVHRADLQAILLAALAPGTLRCGVEVDAVSEDGTSLTLTSTPDRVEPFDLIVAADGIRSRVRAGWPTDPGIRYAGYSAWRGVTSGPVDLRGAAGETWGRGTRFGIAPLQDGRVYWFAVDSMPPATVIDDEYAAVSTLFKSWHAPIGELIGATDPAAVFRLDINELAGTLPSYRRGRCVLLGDAAHAMTPDLGQGGNQALEDAATLVRLIGDAAGAPPGPWIDPVLTEYDRLRRPRTQRLAKQARLVGRVGQTRGAVASRLRDIAMRLLPDAMLGRQLLDVQAWRPPESHASSGAR